MGLFSGEDKTVVSAKVVNLAGDTIRNFVKDSIFASIFMEDNPQIGKDLVKSIINSPGFNLRHFMYWLKNTKKGQDYCDHIGHFYTEFGGELNSDILFALFKSAVPHAENEGVKVESVEVKQADFYYWGAKYIADNYPEYDNDELYSIKCSFSYRNNKTVTVVVHDKTTDRDIRSISFSASDYQDRVRYLYASYQTYNLIPVSTEQGTQWREPEPGEEITYSPMQYVIYAENTPSTGSDYNAGYAALFPESHTAAQKSTFIAPPIPFRTDNWQVSDASKDNEWDWDLYQLSRKAYAKAIGKNGHEYDKLSGKITDNESIDDIDYAYIMFGVSLNTRNKPGKEYLFRYIKALYAQYLAYGSTSVMIQARERHESARSNFRFKISWGSIEHGVMGSGSGDFPEIPEWAMNAFSSDSDHYAVTAFSASQQDLWDTSIIGGNPLTNIGGTTFFIYRKNKNSTQYEYYKVNGLRHSNYVYDGESEVTYASNAFTYEKDDKGEDMYVESPFIFPIHEGIFRQLSALEQAQLSQSFAYMVFNCYEIQHIPWYATGVFKVVITIVMIVVATIATYINPALGGSAYKLSASIMSGLAIGGTTGLVLSALLSVAINMVIALVVSKLIMSVTDALGFNKLLSSIIAVVGATITMVGASQGMDYLAAMNTAPELATTTATASLNGIGESAGALAAETVNQGFGDLMLETAKNGIYSLVSSPISLLKFAGNLFSNIYRGYTQDQLIAMQEESQQLVQDYSRQLYALQQETNAMQENAWVSQVALWKIQTSLDPETQMGIGLLNGTDIATMTLDATVMMVEPNITLV